MKTSTKILLIVVITLSASLCANDAEAGFKKWFKKHAPRPVFVPAPRPVFVPAPMPIVVPAPVVPIHVHSYVRTSRQVWVAPVYSTQITGYDFFGNPIYGQVMTQAGYYRTVFTNTCCCGHSY